MFPPLFIFFPSHCQSHSHTLTHTTRLSSESPQALKLASQEKKKVHTLLCLLGRGQRPPYNTYTRTDRRTLGFVLGMRCSEATAQLASIGLLAWRGASNPERGEWRIPWCFADGNRGMTDSKLCQDAREYQVVGMGYQTGGINRLVASRKLAPSKGLPPALGEACWNDGIDTTLVRGHAEEIGSRFAGNGSILLRPSCRNSCPSTCVGTRPSNTRKVVMEYESSNLSLFCPVLRRV